MRRTRRAMRSAAVLLALLPAGVVAQDEGPPPAPSRVLVGAYVNDIQSVDLKLHSYSVDIYVWFRWSDPALPSPASTVEFVNPSELWGHVQSTSYEEPVELPGGERYQVLRVQGRFSRKLPLYNYPFDRQTLRVAFEDARAEAGRLVYVPDEQGVTLNPELALPGYAFGPPALRVVDTAYPTTFGDPRQRAHDRYSRVQIDLPVTRPAGTYAVKLLLPLVCVVLCASLMMVLQPAHLDARVGIGITALLTIVALQITTNDELPDVDYLVLMDKVYLGAYAYVIAGLAVVVRAARLVDRGDLPAARRLHRRALVALSVGFAVAFAGLVSNAIRVG